MIDERQIIERMAIAVAKAAQDLQDATATRTSEPARIVIAVPRLEVEMRRNVPATTFADRAREQLPRAPFGQKWDLKTCRFSGDQNLMGDYYAGFIFDLKLDPFARETMRKGMRRRWAAYRSRP